ncbi:MAG: hypothetical protein QM484_06860 [Woeseiaceae bacterium]
MTSIISLENAEIIVNNYGKILSSTPPSLYGLPKSLLVDDKEHIKMAIQVLILAVDNHDNKIQEGLIQAYIYLAQFIDDEKVNLAESGRRILENKNIDEDTKSTEDLELANQAVQTINAIKTEMESLMNEIRLVIT